MFLIRRPIYNSVFPVQLTFNTKHSCQSVLLGQFLPYSAFQLSQPLLLLVQSSLSPFQIWLGKFTLFFDDLCLMCLLISFSSSILKILTFHKNQSARRILSSVCTHLAVFNLETLPSSQWNSHHFLNLEYHIKGSYTECCIPNGLSRMGVDAKISPVLMFCRHLPTSA